jgi:hypothetical protein
MILMNTYFMNSTPSRKIEDVEERTEVIYGFENTVKMTLDRFFLTKHTIDSCIDKSNPETIMTVEPIVKAISDLALRGIKSRVITEITRDNILYCKQLMKITTELRHLDEVAGNFSISDKSIYQAAVLGDFSRRYVSESSSVSSESGVLELNPPAETIYSTMGAFVAHQQYFFDMLWKKAIPAKERIKEIEEDLKREFIETIQDSEETLSLISKVITSATEEVLIIFSHANTLRQYHRQGILDLLKKKTDDEIVVKMLVGGEKNIDLLNEYQSIEQRYLLKSIQTKLTTIVADRELSLVIEEKEDKEDAVGLATYSNSESTVLFYASIFENLWIQSEIKQQ